jgi:membrane protein implicated in regulation of membrane protease activity
MSIRLQITILLFMMAQAVFFGIGTIIVLATPLKAYAGQLVPVVIVASAILAAPAAWKIAPRLRSAYSRQKHERLEARDVQISGQSQRA